MNAGPWQRLLSGVTSGPPFEVIPHQQAGVAQAVPPGVPDAVQHAQHVGQPVMENTA
jgi:hypothetical protein